MLEQRLKSHIDILAGDIGERNVFYPQALQEAANYIDGQWTHQGYSVQRQTYTVQGIECANIETFREGDSYPNDIILIGAHYDSVRGSPGANDNGTGIAALVEISRQFLSITPACTIRFVAFVNEEPPFFFCREMGSLVYAKAAKKNGDKIRFMVSLEMLGCFKNDKGSQRYPPLLKYFYPDQANFIAFVSNLKSRRVMHQAAEAFRRHSDFPLEHIATLAIVPGVSESDHLSFWRHGFKAFMVTDTAYYRYPYYHTPYDTADKVCFAEFTRLTQSLADTFIDISKLKSDK